MTIDVSLNVSTQDLLDISNALHQRIMTPTINTKEKLRLSIILNAVDSLFTEVNQRFADYKNGA